jgi:hypothetical protein
MRRLDARLRASRSLHDVLGEWGVSQRKGKGKAKAVSGGGGGGLSTKAASEVGSSGQASSSQGSSRPSAPPARIIGLRTEEEAVQAAPSLAAEAAGSAQQTEPAPAVGGKKEKERERKERQRQRKVDVARQALQWAMEAMAEHGVRCVHSHVLPPSKSHSTHQRCTDGESGACVSWVGGCWSSESTIRTMKEAISEAEKHASRSEPLAALLAEARAALEQALL